MSLVHEALRKAEREKQLKAGIAPTAPLGAHQPTPPPSPQAQDPIVHAPVAATPTSQIPRETVRQPQMPTGERRPQTGRLVLPILIGCVGVVALIAVVFLVSNISSVLRQPKETTPPASAPAAPVPAQPATEPANPPAIAPSVAQPTSDSPTTPSVPASAIPPADESKYNITGIMKDPDGKPVAVINGHVAYEGYYVDGAIVDKIETDRVTLDVKGQKSLLRLH